MKWWGILIIVLIAVGLGVLFYFTWKGQAEFGEKQQEKINVCYEIETCDKWRCLADLPINSRATERNMLLREQNCLLSQSETREAK